MGMRVRKASHFWHEAIALATHQLDEARELGDRIGFMEGGRLQVFERGAIDPASLF